jgi:hypothetical protein
MKQNIDRVRAWLGGHAKTASQWLVLAIILIGIGMRLGVYGDLRLSVATRDTDSYIESSRVNPLSWEAFTTYRPYTTNLIYKVFTPIDGYRNRAISDGDSGTVKRKKDRGAEDIVVLHLTVSIIGWSGLAWVFSSRLKNGIAKTGAAAIVLFFGFTPQVADWDSILSPETLSISLFICLFAVLIWLAFAIHDSPTINAKIVAGFVLFFVILFFWVFTRDVNAYSLIFLVLFIFGLYIFPQYRKTKFFLFAGLTVMSLSLLGGISARQRPLWNLALTHVWVSDILPSQSNVEYMMDRGMPEPGSAEYNNWFNEHAPAKYLQFLIAHPGYTAYKFFKDQDRAFEENLQPHFHANELKYRLPLIMFGNYLHPKSAAVFFAALGLLLGLWNLFLFQKRRDSLPWIWLMTWAFLAAAGTMFLSIFGDSWGLVRHALSSTMTFRLLMWLLILILIDFSMTREEGEHERA